MKKLLGLVALTIFVGFVLSYLHAQTGGGALVVSSCGIQVWAVGDVRSLTMDTTGKAC